MLSAGQLSIPCLVQDESCDDTSSVQQASWYSSDSLMAPRSSHRICFAERMCLTGLDDRMSECSAPMLVRGRDISIDGVSFTHLRPLPYRHIRILMPLATGLESMIMRLTWCRYAKEGEYVSGGYFVRSTDGLTATPDDWDTLDEA